jgi:type IV secretory pathway TraG/TraD family ATPase VirD4
VLQHIQAVGALRQIDRQAYDQTPFGVTVDELNRFAFPNLVPALCMLRDARVQFRLSHQSYGDLEQVSDVFATQVKDNTRCHVFLFENDAQHLEQISKAYGTRTTYKKTVAYARGPLLTLLNTGKVSNREVEEFVLHPNALKNLAPCGQGYVLLPNSVRAVNFEILPRMAVTATLVGRKDPVDGLNLLELFITKGGHSETLDRSFS